MVGSGQPNWGFVWGTGGPSPPAAEPTPASPRRRSRARIPGEAAPRPEAAAPLPEAAPPLLAASDHGRAPLDRAAPEPAVRAPTPGPASLRRRLSPSSGPT